MGLPSTGDITVLPFPFSDLTENKVRPAVVLARANESEPNLSRNSLFNSLERTRFVQGLHVFLEHSIQLPLSDERRMSDPGIGRMPRDAEMGHAPQYGRRVAKRRIQRRSVRLTRGFFTRCGRTIGRLRSRAFSAINRARLRRDSWRCPGRASELSEAVEGVIQQREQVREEAES